MIAIVNTHNADKIVEQYADDVTFQVPGLDAPLHGKVAIRDFLKGNFEAFPDWTMDITKVFVSADETVLVSSARGTHTGPMIGKDGTSVAPTHKKFVQDEMIRVTLNEKGQVKSLRSYGNSADTLRQLGLSK
jgi:steroid delta-isomerase-like uncharacterized protein